MTDTRHTNWMVWPIYSKISAKKTIYFYQKPMLTNCKVTFADGSVFYQRNVTNDQFYTVKGEKDILYLDEQCTKLAPVTRKQKIHECKRAGLI